MLRSAPAALGQCSSWAETTVASGCRLHNLQSIHTPVSPVMPNRIAGLQTRGLYEGAAQRPTSYFLTLRVNGKSLKFWLFVISLYYKKLGRHLKPLLSKYPPDPLGRLENMPEKVYYTELKPIAGSQKLAPPPRKGIPAAAYGFFVSYILLRPAGCCVILREPMATNTYLPAAAVSDQPVNGDFEGSLVPALA